jgi:hypothetical protein
MIRSNLLVFGGTLMVSTLMLAACGGSTPTAGATSAVTSQAATSAAAAATSPAAAAGAAPDACSLITSQEASVALGVDAGTPSAAGGTGTCDYGTANGSIHIIASLYPDSSTAQSLYAASRTAAKGGQPGVQDVSGIGDMAFVTPGGFMEFSKGSTVVIIQVGSSANPSTSTMTTLGQAAAGRV